MRMSKVIRRLFKTNIFSCNLIKLSWRQFTMRL